MKIKRPHKNASRLKWARYYKAKGWQPIPIPKKKKGPALPEWQTRSFKRKELKTHFYGHGNIGLLLGRPSGGLTDIDLDAGEAVSLANIFLPPAKRVSGRSGKRASHWWYKTKPVAKTKKFTDTDGTMLCEIRSTGAQTLVPPSVHPSGELIEWEKWSMDGPPQISSEELDRAVSQLASCALLARHWPRKGSRHEAALAVAGFLLRGGLDEETTVKIVTNAARVAGDEEWIEREGDVHSTAERLRSGEQVTGVPTLRDLLDEDGPKVISRLTKWLELSLSRSSHCPYQVKDGHIVKEKRTRDGGIFYAPLCNFSATITEEIILDNGADTTRAFVLEGHLENGDALGRIRVDANRFSTMNWVTERWGARAVVEAGQGNRDSLREAIQRLSPQVRQRQVFTHTGWRKIDREWVYLTGSGAVGHDGFEVDLGPELSGYNLPGEAEEPVAAMKSSLRLLNLAPLRITAPLLAAIYRAPLANFFAPDLTIWLEGPTGSFKSTLAALYLSHYGDFVRTSLPGAWESTANQLERRAFVLKDVPFVIDDFAPSGLNNKELQVKALRLMRAQGNLAGRGRLRSDLSERPGFPPRGLIISTGEQHPSGQSILARTILIELTRNDVDQTELTQLQEIATQFPHAMAGYVAWLAPRIEKLPPLLRQRFHKSRSQMFSSPAHPRVPEALSHLWLGLRSMLDYSLHIGASSAEETKELRKRCWRAFKELRDAQSQLVEQERPSRRYLTVLASLITQGRVHLLAKSGKPSHHQSGSFVGWYDDQFLYLLPDPTFTAVAQSCRDSGEPFVSSSERLRRDLKIEGISECDAERLTATVWIGGTSRRVLKLKIEAVERLLGVDFLTPHRSSPVSPLSEA